MATLCFRVVTWWIRPGRYRINHQEAVVARIAAPCILKRSGAKHDLRRGHPSDEQARSPRRRCNIGRMTPISVLILTLNEEINLADCLNSCAWCDDIVVLTRLAPTAPQKSPPNL